MRGCWRLLGDKPGRVVKALSSDLQYEVGGWLLISQCVELLSFMTQRLQEGGCENRLLSDQSCVVVLLRVQLMEPSGLWLLRMLPTPGRGETAERSWAGAARLCKLGKCWVSTRGLPSLLRGWWEGTRAGQALTTSSSSRSPRRDDWAGFASQSVGPWPKQDEFHLKACEKSNSIEESVSLTGDKVRIWLWVEWNSKWRLPQADLEMG